MAVVEEDLALEPPSGQWFESYAVQLAANAGY